MFGMFDQRYGSLLFLTLIVLCNVLHHRVSGQTTDYCKISSCQDGQQTMCLYKSSTPSTKCNRYNQDGLLKSKDNDDIVNRHNVLRAIVASGQEKRGKTGQQPSASNMKKMKWDKELAQVAQRYADQCLSDHDKCRNVARFNVGQNIVTSCSTGQPNMKVEDLIQYWYDEVSLFDKKYVSKYQFEASTGHYTQLVWAETSLIGCGRVLFWDTDRKMNCVRLICNYAPAGNFIGQSIYRIGTAASACPSGVSSTSSSLCN